MSSVTISEYSQWSLVVRGDTRSHKDALKSLGGKWNKYLKRGGAGWIFPKKKKEDLKKLERARQTSRRRLLLIIAGLSGIVFWKAVPTWLSVIFGGNRIMSARQVPKIGILAGGLSWTGAVGFSSLVGVMQAMGLLL